MQSAHEEIEWYARVDHEVRDTALEALELVGSAYDLYLTKEPS